MKKEKRVVEIDPDEFLDFKCPYCGAETFEKKVEKMSVFHCTNKNCACDWPVKIKPTVPKQSRKRYKVFFRCNECTQTWVRDLKSLPDEKQFAEFKCVSCGAVGLDSTVSEIESFDPQPRPEIVDFTPPKNKKWTVDGERAFTEKELKETADRLIRIGSSIGDSDAEQWMFAILITYFELLGLNPSIEEKTK